MTKKEIEKKITEMKTRIEELEDGIEELEEELERVEDINPDLFIPTKDERFWSIDEFAMVYSNIWQDKTDNKDRLAIGNVFQTKEEAEFEIERLKVIYELRQYAEQRDIVWDSINKYYYIAYGSDSKDIHVFYDSWYSHNDIYFSSEDRAWEAIKAVGEDRVKKYYLCVEEE